MNSGEAGDGETGDGEAGDGEARDGETGDGEASGFRSGFACFVGRPNAGKSTLMNSLVGSKVAITADQPQTTRRAIRGIVHRADAQLVIVDTPGLHRPRTLLGERLNALVRGTLAEVDVIGFCLPANERIGPGDRFIAEEVGRAKPPVVAIVTKTDLVKPAALAEHLLAVDALGDWVDIVPVSAVAGTRVDALADVLVSHLPPGPALYPDGDLTDEPENIVIAELVREAALEGAREELPHSLAVVVEEVTERNNNERVANGDSGGEGAGEGTGREGAGREGNGRQGDDPDRLPLMDVRVTLFVERDSQKGIVIGHRGERLKEIGSQARKGIEALLGRRVFLDIRVKVAKNWQRDPKQLGRLGF